MKKAIFSILILILSISIASASIDVEYRCHSKNCLEGTDIDYSFIIYNNIDKKIDIKDVFLKETETNRILEYYEISERILPKESKSFNFTSKIKAPNKGYTFYFYPCFTTVISNQSHITEAGTVCGEVVKSFTTIPLSKIECTTDKECSNNEYCNTDLLKCKPTECQRFEIIRNHKCAGLSIYILPLLGIIIILIVITLFRRKHKKGDENEENEEESETKLNSEEDIATEDNNIEEESNDNEDKEEQYQHPLD
ncbi:MAG: hypothetical protein QF362_01515 [Candidatus Woesearchaeota archaeon]|jgi:hypothetical protein|nr:hypothetical protein [Candidatus Woesearchaeota archaeon]MDP7506101.1 hypothetical protein [Candidatus Woesearchaeota archaeon]MDP7610411.1 hypothetical protein [Candidatus Woesearchaeota archaeon]|tara:strand:- start:369 stop:1127 length:759 start_codon:yes stop_codon:yes gene_type:complete